MLPETEPLSPATAVLSVPFPNFSREMLGKSDICQLLGAPGSRGGTRTPDFALPHVVIVPRDSRTK